MQTYLEIPIGSQKLAACLHSPAPDGKRRPLVICCHGLTGTRFGSGYRFVQLGRRLSEHGIACLRFDFRGCAESDGRFEDVTLTSLQEDLFAVCQFMRGHPACDAANPAFVGSSFGAFTAAHVAGKLGKIGAMVFLAPVSHPGILLDRGMTPAAWEHLARHGWVDHNGMPLGKGFIEQAMKADGPAALSKISAPMLIFHGGGDREVPIDQGRSYEAQCKSTGCQVIFVEFDSNDHGMRGVELSRRIVEESTAFLRQHLHA
jgi:pimeloyl-ACP methyl ester carboxylesterase